MRLLIATPLYPPEPGGPATYTRLLEEGLPSRGIEVEVVKFADVRRLPKLIRHYAYYRRVAKAARRADAILALDPVSVGLPALRAAKKARKPFFLKVVGDYAWEQGRQRFGVTAPLDEFIGMKQVPLGVALLRAMQAHVGKCARGVIVPSAYLRGVVRAWGVPEERITVMHNAVSADTASAVPEEVERLPIPRIVSAGRLVPWKGMGELIDAVARLRARGTNASLVIVGDGPERATLARRAAETLGAGYLFTGALPHDKTLATMKDADVFVLNSSYEGLSHVLIEAQLLDVPVVTTGAGGNGEVTSDGVDALWADPSRPDRLADAIEKLLLDRTLARKLASAGKMRAEREFSSETLLENMAVFLKTHL